MNEPYFLDTNILMYAVGADHPLKRPCLAILRRASEGEIRIVTDTEVFQEVAHRYWSQRKWATAIKVLADYEVLFDEIYAIEKRHLAPYYRLLGDFAFLSPRDAIHVAVMKVSGIKNIYTADKAFKRLSFLNVEQPSASS